EADEAVLEIATDKVDSEVPSEVAGVLVEKLFQADDVVQVGQTIAVIETEGQATAPVSEPKQEVASNVETAVEIEESIAEIRQTMQPVIANSSDRFYSPLVKNIAASEGISQAELDAVNGTGKDGRVTK